MKNTKTNGNISEYTKDYLSALLWQNSMGADRKKDKKTMFEICLKMGILGREINLWAITEYKLQPNRLIREGDIIIRRSNGEIDVANDEWWGEKHEDWVRAIKIEK